MNVFELTRKLVDIESVTPNEEAIGDFLFAYLQPFVREHNGRIEKVEVEPRRNNIFAYWGDVPVVTLSTHLDTVPPFFASSEDAEFLHGRGACDVKGIIASMIHAAIELLAQGIRKLTGEIKIEETGAPAAAQPVPREQLKGGMGDGAGPLFTLGAPGAATAEAVEES